MSGLLSSLLDPGFRQPASCLIEVGDPAVNAEDIAPLIASVEITVTRSEAATGMIVIDDIRKEDGEWMAADSGLFERWMPIRVSADFQTHVEEVFRGYVTELKPSYPASGAQAKLELTVQDDSTVLNREQMRTVWGAEAPMSDLDILTALLAPAGLAPTPDSGRGQSSRSLSQDATPIQFIRERAKANGYELIFAEGQTYFGPMRLDGEAQAPIMIYAGAATNCLNFQVSDDAQKPDAVQFDMANKESGSDTVTATIEPAVTVLGTSAAAAEGANLGTPSVWRISKEGDETEEEMRARAQALADENSFKLRATGELDGTLYGHVLRVAQLVTVDGAGSRYGGPYYVDRVMHQFTPDGYRQQFELMRNAVGDTQSAGGALGAATSAISGLFG